MQIENNMSWIDNAVEALSDEAVIGKELLKEKSRKKLGKANWIAETNGESPSPTKSRKGRQALEAAKTIMRPPDANIEGAKGTATSNIVQPPQTQLDGQFEGDNQQASAVQPHSDAGHLEAENHVLNASIGKLIEQYRRRQDMLRGRVRIELQAQSVCRRMSDGDKVKGAKLWAAVKKNEGHELRSWLGPYLEAMKPLHTMQLAIEKEIEKQVVKFPIWSWAEDIKGFGKMSVAAVIGECAAPIGEYKSVSAVWKRMGLAVIGGGRQRKVKGDAAIEHGYNADRRSLMWNIGGCLMKAQIRSEKGDDGKKIAGSEVAIGEYGQIYLDRKALELAKPEVETPMHAHNRAKRYMEKRLLREMWKAWRALDGLPCNV